MATEANEQKSQTPAQNKGGAGPRENKMLTPAQRLKQGRHYDPRVPGPFRHGAPDLGIAPPDKQ